MARILPDKAVPEFLAAYGVTELGDECPPGKLIVKVWDLHGSGPKDGEETGGTGTFIAAVVICDECSRSVELHRERLSR